MEIQANNFWNLSGNIDVLPSILAGLTIARNEIRGDAILLDLNDSNIRHVTQMF